MKFLYNFCFKFNIKLYMYLVQPNVLSIKICCSLLG
nr:MAG TPA: hypothetical protein [Bacteriophage sp.]